MKDEIKEESITLTMSQLDDLLKKWKKKGADRVFGWVFIGAIPLGVIAMLMTDRATKDELLLGCISYFISLCAAATLTMY